MKNEKMAQAMTHIDDALILEAAEVGAGRRGHVLRLQRSLARWGSLAACLLIAVTVVLSGMNGGVSMDGVRLDGEPTIISASSWRSAPTTISAPSELTPPDFTLDFGKSIKLEAQNGQLAEVLSDGSLRTLDGDVAVRGVVTLRLRPSAEATQYTITTSRDYSIVIESVNGEWYVSIEK